MWTLLLSTILTSAADSLNPIAITQQFVLQGMVKKPAHILYFVIPTGIVNMAGGYLAYYGLMAFIGNFLKGLIASYGVFVFACELLVGIALLIAVCYILQNAKIRALQVQLNALRTGSTESDEAEAARKIKSVSPPALVALGAGATISELTTALPYFAFLAILFNYELTFLQMSLILLVYNVIYTLPLILLYLVYLKAQAQFDGLYACIKAQVAKWSGILAPTLAGLAGGFLVLHAMTLLVK
jgi:hypothetical protein